jgi:probable phosphoglycerate mutase
MQTRMWAQLNQLADHHKGSTVVAVSHADTIKAAVAMASGTPLDLFQRYVISPCSATLLLFTGAGPMVLAVNTNGEGLGDLRLA